MKEEIKKYLESQTIKTHQEIHMVEFGRKLAICVFIILGLALIAGIIGIISVLI